MEQEGKVVCVWNVIYTLMKVRGWKTIRRLLSVDVQDFISLVGIVNKRKKEFGEWRWEVRYGFWVWFSSLILVPFGLDSLVAEEEEVEVVMGLGMEEWGRSGIAKEGACAFLGRFLTRRDQRDGLERFLREVFCGSVEKRGGRSGKLRTVAGIFKMGNRLDTQRYVGMVLPVVVELLDGSRKVELNEEERYLALKLLSRLALVCLPPRLAKWRYERGSRFLFGLSSDADQADSVTYETLGYSGHTEDIKAVNSGTRKQNEAMNMKYETEKQDDERLVDEKSEEVVETVVEILLTYMQNASTKIRWTSAKAFGRITSRLPLEPAGDIVDIILDAVLDPLSQRKQSTWHGGLLALAELARHGAILPNTTSFTSFVDVACRATKFDIRVREHSAGTNVRDSACYVFWAMARAYASDIIVPYSKQIADALLPLALFDREVGCRRAAAAAYQECVGRTQAFEHGIQVIGIINFFTVSNRQNCYGTLLDDVVKVGDGTFRTTLAEELRERKVSHWDVLIRQLAADSLARITDKLEVEELTMTMMKRVERKYGDPAARHGAMLVLSHLVKRFGSNKAVVEQVQELLVSDKDLSCQIVCFHLRRISIGSQVVSNQSSNSHFSSQTVSVSFSLKMTTGQNTIR